jgi:hypothetical protein
MTRDDWMGALAEHLDRTRLTSPDEERRPDR